MEFRVTKLDDIINKVIPFLLKYPVIGVKSQGFADWCKVADMIKDKKHLIKKGLDKIKRIKAGMNRDQKFN